MSDILFRKPRQHPSKISGTELANQMMIIFANSKYDSAALDFAACSAMIDARKNAKPTAGNATAVISAVLMRCVPRKILYVCMAQNPANNLRLILASGFAEPRGKEIKGMKNGNNKEG